MPNYLRLRSEAATYFFTLVTHKRCPFLIEPWARECLHFAWQETRTRYPFDLLAVCLLPDHLHTLWTLPEGDSDFPKRWRFLKARFTWRYLRGGAKEGSCSDSRLKKGERGVWQRRYWEHLIRDENDLSNHFDYIHYNPVKHGLVQIPEQWPWSTFHRYARLGWYDLQWGDSPIERIDNLDYE